jgi:DNA invertase Pin-like site-specific DNA recombinase
MPRLALYCRASTIEQHVEPQLHALRSYAEARGFEVVGTYVDHGVSGAKDRRPALDRLLADARRRSVDAVAVTKLDRLGRSLRHLLVLVGELEALGIDFISLDDGPDTSACAWNEAPMAAVVAGVCWSAFFAAVQKAAGG